MIFGAANDGAVSLDDAIRLVDEVERLRRQVKDYKLRIEELDRLAHLDTLVSLPNRRSFLANLERLICRSNRYGGQGAVIFVDVDGLKAINDRLGHKAGDEALIEVSKLLVKSVRSGDLVARLAGDEFGILLEQSDELAAWQTALRVIETVDDCEFCAEGVCLPLSVAVGVAVIQPDDQCSDVLARADKEMYRIKAMG
jgi:diguanylate cyclase (GGDEF)-like protein